MAPYEINKIYWPCFDDKIYILNNGYDGFALLVIKVNCIKKTVVLITIQNSFF